MRRRGCCWEDGEGLLVGRGGEGLLVGTGKMAKEISMDISPVRHCKYSKC